MNKQLNIKYSHLKTAVVIYAAIPIAGFFIGWLNVFCAILFTLLLGAAVFFCIKSAAADTCEHKCVTIPGKRLVIIAIIAVAWCFLAGQGGFVHQSSDHLIRNRIILDMVVKPWPVTNNNDRFLLCYYIAHWIIPTAIGKVIFILTGAEFAGYLAANVALLIWSSMGVFLTLLLVVLVTDTGKKAYPVLCSLLFIFFSGLDMVNVYLSGHVGATHMEWWADYFQFSSNSTCLFWVYNQTIAVWLVTLCILNENTVKSFALLGMLAFPFGPFPFVGIVILCLIKAVSIFINQIKSKEYKALFRSIVSPQNILGTAAIAPVFALYYISNMIMTNSVTAEMGEHVESGFRFHSVLAGLIADGDMRGSASFIWQYVLFMLLEVGIYAIILIIGNRKKQDRTLLASIAVLFVIPLFQIGMSYDFCMRVSIPLLVYLCIAMIRLIKRELPEKSELKNIDSFIKKRCLLLVSVVVLLFGAINPLTEFIREISLTIENGNSYSLEVASMDEYDEKFNFVAEGYQDSLFYKLMRH